jgi:phage-related protein
VPPRRLVLYQHPDGHVPFLDWLRQLVPKARAKCRVRLERLAELGHELRRPEGDYLRDGIYELRARHGGMNYRMLYFFHGQDVAVLSHGLSKQKAKVPPRDIDLASARRKSFGAEPDVHTYEEDA